MRIILKIKIFLFVLMNCSGNFLFGQDITIIKNGEKQEIYLDKSEACDKDLVFMVVEEMPVYKGGLKQLECDLNKVVSFDKEAKEKFYLRCTINCKGEIFGFQDIQKNNSAAKEKIQNELLKLQNWEAGKQRGTQVDCFYGFDIKIKKGNINLSR